MPLPEAVVDAAETYQEEAPVLLDRAERYDGAWGDGADDRTLARRRDAVVDAYGPVGEAYQVLDAFLADADCVSFPDDTDARVTLFCMDPDVADREDPYEAVAAPETEEQAVAYLASWHAEVGAARERHRDADMLIRQHEDAAAVRLAEDGLAGSVSAQLHEKGYGGLARDLRIVRPTP